MLGAIREQVRLYPGRGKQLLQGLQQQFPPWQHGWVDGGYRTTLIASLQQELGGTVEPLRPPHALVAGLPHAKRDGGAKITSASPKLKKLSFTQRGYGVYF
ncbi:MAG: hypothetical protein BRC44_14585 [Cyanobacteria bacterium QS_4_48_99]|nr:MAG: hypothetical protein BRC44_14585 [Cyanobacteria bacterium QS_4_48_99]